MDLPEVLRSYLPAFMSLGTGLGIALHSLLYRCQLHSSHFINLTFFSSSWDSKMLGRQLPSLTWNSANQLTIAYSNDNVKLEEVIPVAIAEDGEHCFQNMLSLRKNKVCQYTLRACHVFVRND